MNRIETEDPFARFEEWYAPVIATGRENSNAVILATSGWGGRVSSRVVLLKQYDRNGFLFFTNYGSRKGRDLDFNSFASLLFYWPESARQIRIEGITEKATPQESDAYFDSRRRGHKINAFVSRQSSRIESENEFRRRITEAEERFGNSDPSRPEWWGGIRLVPDRFEFWEEGADRFHHREEYLFTGEGWERGILYP